jgi:hypothetical protein
MASNDREAEETRIRRALVINSFDLAVLEKYLEQAGHVPDSADEEAVRESVSKLRQLYLHSMPTFERPNLGLHRIFELPPPEMEPDKKRTLAEREAARFEAESVKYDAVRDLIRMLAMRKAQASEAQQQQQQEEDQGAQTVVKEEDIGSKGLAPPGRRLTLANRGEQSFISIVKSSRTDMLCRMW